MEDTQNTEQEDIIEDITEEQLANEEVEQDTTEVSEEAAGLEDDVAVQLEKAQTEAVDLENRLLRLAAEFENYKNRIKKYYDFEKPFYIDNLKPNYTRKLEREFQTNIDVIISDYYYLKKRRNKVCHPPFFSN